jgi:hypothetical protein
VKPASKINRAALGEWATPKARVRVPGCRNRGTYERVITAHAGEVDQFTVDVIRRLALKGLI